VWCQVALVRVMALTATTLMAASAAYAQSGDALREAAQNPIASLISVPFQNNTNFGVGQLNKRKTFSTFSPSFRSASIGIGT
jgi:hypothetical protein